MSTHVTSVIRDLVPALRVVTLVAVPSLRCRRSSSRWCRPACVCWWAVFVLLTVHVVR